MKLIISYTCPETFKPSELVLANPTHIPRIGDTVKCISIVTRRGVIWPEFKVVDVIWDYISDEIEVKLEK
jgi:hypothetical protein